MNTKQAKAEPLTDFLAHMGYQPAHIRGNDVWYTSPFRPDERTPSFKIDRLKNVWFDHGLGQGGTIIDFVQHLNHTADIAKVLSSIEGVLGSPSRPELILPKGLEKPPSKPRDPPIIEGVGVIQNKLLEAYLIERSIPVDLARLYLKEVSYRVGGAGYKALAFENDAGGMEVRNASFKGTLGKKELSFISSAGSRQAAVFEGVFDFLSVLAHYKKERVTSNVVVLNSLSMIERAVVKLEAANVQKIHAYLDHDEAGIAGLATLRERGAWDLLDESHLYRGHKDANEFLM